MRINAEPKLKENEAALKKCVEDFVATGTLLKRTASRHARHQGNPHQDRECEEHSEDHQGHADGGHEQDAPRAGAHAPGAPVCARRCATVIGHLTQANPDYRHPFLLEREVKAVGIIVISTDRGLAGGLNANVFKQTLLADARVAGEGRAA